MDPRRIASTAAVLGGLAWLARVVLVWMSVDQTGDAGVPGALFWAGLAALALGLAAGGYTLVETAPLWLRGVVTIAVPLLVFMIWVLLGQAIDAVYTADDWLREELDVAVAGVIALLLGVWGFTRRGPGREQSDPPPSARGHHAAR